VRYSLEKDFSLGPFGTYQTLALGFPLSIWDQNKGNIIAAQAALVRAGEESHRVQVTLTNGLALAYEGYRNNLYAMEYYRRYILPDLVRYYRGVFARRQIGDPSSSFGDLVFAQQNLSTNVTSYIGILGSLWSSVVSVADYLQTDDLFQFARPRELPEVPDLSRLPALWACGHAAACDNPSAVSEPILAAPPAGLPLSRPAGGAPAGPAGSATGAQAPQAREPAAPAAPAPGTEPPAGQPPASPADAPQPPSPLGTQRDRLPGPQVARDTGPVGPVTSYFGKGENHEGQDF